MIRSKVVVKADSPEQAIEFARQHGGALTVTQFYPLTGYVHGNMETETPEPVVNWFTHEPFQPPFPLGTLMWYRVDETVGSRSVG